MSSPQSSKWRHADSWCGLWAKEHVSLSIFFISTLHSQRWQISC